MKIKEINNSVILEDVKCFDPFLTLDCGQTFRFKKTSENSIHGVAGNKVLDLTVENGKFIFHNTTSEDFNSFWFPYFDFGRDYENIIASFDDKYLKKACEQYYGIRIVKQDMWEALCSFIISQNNNIPRIKGIIERLCENFGEKISGNDYAFPTPEKIAGLTEKDLSVLRAGFRNKYILDAAEKTASKKINPEIIENADIEEARRALMEIKGVGPKVAECVLLYGAGRVDAFPVDVWVKRICAELYPDGLPECMKGVRGIAQQYLFHWRRNIDQ